MITETAHGEAVLREMLGLERKRLSNEKKDNDNLWKENVELREELENWKAEAQANARDAENTHDLMTENCDLLQRAETAEATLNPALEELEKAGWPCRLVELPALYVKAANKYQKLRARLEQMNTVVERLASPEAFTLPRVATEEETARMKYAQSALEVTKGGE